MTFMKYPDTQKFDIHDRNVTVFTARTYDSFTVFIVNGYFILNKLAAKRGVYEWYMTSQRRMRMLNICSTWIYYVYASSTTTYTTHIILLYMNLSREKTPCARHDDNLKFTINLGTQPFVTKYIAYIA